MVRKLNSFRSSLTVDIDANTAMDIEQLSNGGFWPLRTFMNFEDLDSVLRRMRLTTGEVWPIPILFPEPADCKIFSGTTLLLKFEGVNFAQLDVSDVFKYDIGKLVKLFYGTNDTSHPGVSHTKKLSNTFLTGKLRRIEKLTKLLGITAMDPIEAKRIIKEKKWKKIVGFHTRNPPHRAHEFLQKCSLENADGLFIHPVVGSKKKGDFSDTAILRGYKHYIENYLPRTSVILTPLLTYSRYAGPREAIFTAIVRRNYGCTHFIVGRDHTGVMNFYGKYDSQKIFNGFKDIGIEILHFDEPYYCRKCKQVTTSKTCPHNIKYHIEISGTKIRKAILHKSKISDILIRKEVIDELKKIKNVFS